MENWDDLTPIEKTEQIRDAYFKGLSPYAIHKKLKVPESEIKHYLQIIQTHSFKTEESQRYLDDIQTRTMEHLASLDYRYDQAFRILEHSQEMIVALDDYGNPMKVRDKTSGQPTNVYELRPRNINAVSKLMKQLDVISHEKAEILKVISAKQEMHVTLQTTMNVQAIILDIFKSLQPDAYEQAYRAITSQHDGYIEKLPMTRVTELNG